jgi:hypothetical protein
MFPLATHLVPSQQPPFAHAAAPAQQVCPVPPQIVHTPPLHMPPLEHMSPFAMQPVVSQQPPPKHLGLLAQQALALVPHCWHTPPRQISFATEHCVAAG